VSNPPRIASGGEPERVRLDYVKQEIWLLASSKIEREQRANACAKEPWTISWLETYVKPGDVVYDVGANVGAFSLVAAKHCGAVAYAFEPGYASYARLCDNIVLNGCDDAIIALPWALSDTRGLTALRYRSLEPGQSRHRLEDSPWRPRKDPWKTQTRYRQPICTMRMDDAVRLFRLPPPAHVKIDVDGAEDRVLKGALKTLKSPGLRSVLVEVEAVQWDSVATHLADAGLELRSRYDRTNPEAPYYGLFVRSRSG
jgi:FkbM family methyltransferase